MQTEQANLDQLRLKRDVSQKPCSSCLHREITYAFRQAHSATFTIARMENGVKKRSRRMNPPR